MELNSNKLQFSFFLLLSSLIFRAHSTPHLDRSNRDAFTIIQRDLGIYDQHPSFTTTPCYSAAISCSHRVSTYSSVLEITHIIYDSEQLGGSISAKIGQLSELRELSLTNNHLVGQLPKEITDCKKLEVLNLRNNRFSGNVPSELSKLVNLRVLDLSGNRFSGVLTFLKYFPNLQKLSIADNLFTGKMPSSVHSFNNLKIFSTEMIVPRRDMLAQNSTRTRNAGSPAEAPLSSSVLQNEHKSNKKLATWLIGLVVGLGFGYFSGLAISVFVKVGLDLIRKRENSLGISTFFPRLLKAEDLAFLEKEDGLSGLQVIGKGGCGEVYKAELPESNCKIIAIKKIILSPEEDEDINDEDSKVLSSNLRQIRAEIQTIGEIRHSNVLPLLAHVIRPKCHYLVYEFVKNGSLQDKMVEATDGNIEFDWLTRYKIALGVATGIEYLHVNNSPQIIHRDLKPGNVLLNDEMEPLIADFGLAKKIPNDKTHMTTSNVVGTLGYIAPEYYQTGKFTEKCDVYSFGVILGSLVIGKLLSDQFFQETDEIHMVMWMRNIMTSEDPTAALDPRLRGNGYEEQMLHVLKIACYCTVQDPKQRPDSKDVRCMLSQINHSHTL